MKCIEEDRNNGGDCPLTMMVERGEQELPPIPCHYRDPAVLALLDLEACKMNPSSDTIHSTSRDLHICYCVHSIDSLCDDLTGWEGEIARPTNSTHCVVPLSPSSTSLCSASDTSVIQKVGHRPSSHTRTSVASISKSDSKSSLRSYMFEPQHIPYNFTHYKVDEDMSAYVEKYKEVYTYPNIQLRMKSNTSSRVSLCANCSLIGSSHQISAMLKPKLVVLGETSGGYVKPVWKKVQPKIECHLDDHVTDQSAVRRHVTTLRSNGVEAYRHITPMEPYLHHPRYEPDSHSTSSPTSTATVTEEEPELLRTETKDQQISWHESIRNRPSRDVFIRGENSPRTKKKAPVMSVKWASKVFPSFVVSSANTNAQKTRTSSTKTATSKTPSQAPRLCSKPLQAYHSLKSRSMPLISPTGLATKNEFSHLLRHQTQVSFHNNRQGFRYETVCLHGSSTNTTSSSPVTVVGPWITSP